MVEPSGAGHRPLFVSESVQSFRLPPPSSHLPLFNRSLSDGSCERVSSTRLSRSSAAVLRCPSARYCHHRGRGSPPPRSHSLAGRSLCVLQRPLRREKSSCVVHAANHDSRASDIGDHIGSKQQRISFERNLFAPA